MRVRSHARYRPAARPIPGPASVRPLAGGARRPRRERGRRHRVPLARSLSEARRHQAHSGVALVSSWLRLDGLHHGRHRIGHAGRAGEHRAVGRVSGGQPSAERLVHPPAATPLSKQVRESEARCDHRLGSQGAAISARKPGTAGSGYPRGVLDRGGRRHPKRRRSPQLDGCLRVR